MRGLLVLLACLPLGVNAGGNAALLKALLENGAISTQQYESLLAAEPPSSEVDARGGLKLNSYSGHSVQIGGRVEAHAAWYKDDKRDLGDGAILRRARFFIKGTHYDRWHYKLDYDLVDGGLKGLKDAYLGYRRDNGVQLYAGNYRVPFSLEFQANPHANMFMERALPFAFAPGWRVGGAMRIPGKEWLVEAGVFGDRPAKAGDSADGEGVAALRVSGRPLVSGDSYLHLGGAFLYRSPGDQQAWRYRSKPESRVTSTDIIDTGKINGVEGAMQWGVEIAYSTGRFNIQAEHMIVDIRRQPSDASFNGWYLQSSLFLTKDRRRYRSGRYIPIKPAAPLGRGGSGAWEVALRLSSLDLSDADIQGGKAKQATVALNVYATQHIRMSAELIHAFTGDDRPGTAQLRAEWVF